MELQFNAVNGNSTVYVNPTLPSSNATLTHNKSSRRFPDSRVANGQVIVNQIFPYSKDKPCATTACDKVYRDNAVYIKVSAPSEDVVQALAALDAAYANARVFIERGGLAGVRASINADYFVDAVPLQEGTP